MKLHSVKPHVECSGGMLMLRWNEQIIVGYIYVYFVKNAFIRGKAQNMLLLNSELVFVTYICMLLPYTLRNVGLGDEGRT